MPETKSFNFTMTINVNLEVGRSGPKRARAYSTSINAEEKRLSIDQKIAGATTTPIRARPLTSPSQGSGVKGTSMRRATLGSRRGRRDDPRHGHHRRRRRRRRRRRDRPLTRF